jgi:vibriolysin
MKRLLAVATFFLCTVAFAKSPASESKIKIHGQDQKGVPTFVTGELGKLGPGSSEKAARDFMRGQKDLLQQTGSEDFDAVATTKDHLGQTHVRLRQNLRGLPVIGAEYIVHSDANGNVVAINGRFAPDNDVPRNPSVDAWSALTRAAGQANAGGNFTDSPELVYVVNEKSNIFLAWRATVSYEDAEGPQKDIIYADATTGDLVLRDAQFKRARNRSTYNLNNGTTLPGTLVLTETGGTTTDTAIQAAHNYAGTTYDYYLAVHSRDSYDNAGAAMKSSVHYSSGYNNAYWNGTQMVYGDGDGTTFIPLSKALDVDAHELTHAVTERTAGLVYSNESGALNEATSDIMASAVESWKKGAVDSNSWKVGEDIYTPSTAGDALRYMNDPALAGDYDYYPTRYTGTSDNGGVHTNSGIANLAFYMMTMGGTHPRGKTSVSVPALNATPLTSINMAAKIWYRALTVYMTSSTTFSAARTATVQAATDLYGAAAADSVTKAWDCVGAPGGSTGGGGVTTLSNGQTVSSQSGSTGTWKYFKIAVPASQSLLKITMSGGTGDADLYVKLGSQPTSSSYNYRPYLSGNAESVSVTNPASGDWYIGIYAYSTYSGVSLNATYSASTGSTCTSYSGTLAAAGTGYQPSSTGYSSTISGTHTGKLTGPTGTDFDLYLQKLSGTTWSNVGAGETSTSVENITYSGTAGSYRWRVYAYSGSGSYTLCTTKP